MANPRKFSEKIALLNQKEAEGNAEFERIMREVADTKGDETTTTTLAGLLTTGYSNDITSKNGTNNGSSSNINNSTKNSTRESRGRSPGGGPIRARNRNIDTSPYSSTNNAYLSPPDSSWRRTSSDSAIHQSLTQAQDIHNNSAILSPRAHKRLLSSSQSNSMKDIHHQQQQQQQSSSMNQNLQNINLATLSAQQSPMVQQQILNQSHLLLGNLQQDNKSRSHSRLPGIKIHPTQNNDTLQIPIGNSTGSLPDLTLVHYQQSPLSNPLDLENEHIIAVTNGTFNSNTFSSPMEISTNFGQQQMFQQIGHNQQNSTLEDFNGKHFNNNNSNSNNLNSNKVSTSSQGFQQGSNQTTYAQQSSPIPIDSQRQQQHSPLHHQSYPNNQISAEKLMSYRNVNTASPANLSSSQGNLSKSYQSSPHNRPSPGSSPNNLSTNFDSNSSAPCSPASAGNNGQFETFPVDSYYVNQSFQQNFENFSLIDNSPNDYITSTNEQHFSQMTENVNGFSDESPNRQSPTARSRTSSQSNDKCSNSNRQTCGSNNHSSNGAGSPHSPLSNDSMLTGGSNYDNIICDNLRSNIMDLNEDFLNGSSGVNDIMFGCDLGVFSDSKSLSNSNSLLLSQTSPSHNLSNVQTPTSVPMIVFSDYSSELLTDSFLGELGTNDLQMFENTTVVDQTAEDSFRRDLCLD